MQIYGVKIEFNVVGYLFSMSGLHFEDILIFYVFVCFV